MSTMSLHSISRPSTMPNPRSDEAPYFDDRRNDPIAHFLFEYDTLATGRGLSDSEKVQTIVYYIARPMRDLWKTLDGYSTGDWEAFKLTLESLYPDTSATRYTLRTLQDFVDISANTRMRNEDDVMTYYRRFLTLSNPLIDRNISNSGRNIEFFRGFHPDDREPLRFRVSVMKPDQPIGEPYDLKDVLKAARLVFSGVQLSDFRPRELRDDPIQLHHVDRDEWMRRTFGPEDRNPTRFRQDRESLYDRDSMDDHDSRSDNGSRDSPRDRDVQEMSSQLPSTFTPQPRTRPTTSLINQPDGVATYFRPGRRNRRCSFCNKLGHYVRECSAAMKYVSTGRALIINDLHHLPNGEPIPNDGKGRGLKSAIDEWLAANTVSCSVPSTLLLTL